MRLMTSTLELLFFVVLSATLPTVSWSSEPDRPDVSAKALRPICPRVGGIITSVLVKDGATVQAGQVIAVLDSAELDHRIESIGYEIAILEAESQNALCSAAGGSTAKIADRRIISLRLLATQCNLRYAISQRTLLEVRAPCPGLIATRNPDWMVGRSAVAGEPLFFIIPTVREDDQS